MRRSSIRFLLTLLGAAVVCLLTVGVALAGQPRWTLVVGTDPLEQVAAEDLVQFLSDELKLPMGEVVAAETYAGSNGAIFIGTLDDNRFIADAHKVKPFTLNPRERESYHFAFRDGNLYIVGQGAKGAMNGVFRFEDRRTTDFTNLDEHATPAFKYRVGGHKINQHPPADWSEDDQARYYAKNYINACWGEKRGAPMSYAARKRWGVGLMLEATLPPVGSTWLKRPGDEAWMKDPAHASCIYHWGRKSWYENVTVIDPFDPVGRKAYLDYFDRLLTENPDTRVLYAIFGDYSWAPNEQSTRVSDGKKFEHTHEESIKEILRLMKEAIGDRDCTPALWMWLLHPPGGKEAFMKEMASLGYGVINNENTNGDNWIHDRDNFDPIALRSANGKSVFGEDYMVLTSIGGACETVEPTVGIPLPHVASAKLRKLADAGVNNFIMWWASCEGWVYQANLSAIREMIWNPQAFDPSNKTPFDPLKGEPLTLKIAHQDFGEALAPEVLNLWREFDRAFVNVGLDGKKTGLQIWDWNQRLGNFTNNYFLMAYDDAYLPAVLSDKKKYKTMYPWCLKPEVAENFRDVTEHLTQVVAHAESLRNRQAPPAVAKRLRDMHQQLDVLRLMLTSQYHLIQALNVLDQAEKDKASDADIHSRFEPIVRAEITTMRSVLARLAELNPNYNIGENLSSVVKNQGSVAKEKERITKKIDAMQAWLEGKP